MVKVKQNILPGKFNETNGQRRLCDYSFSFSLAYIDDIRVNVKRKKFVLSKKKEKGKEEKNGGNIIEKDLKTSIQ